MKRERIQGSNNVVSIGHENGVMHIEFQGGNVYEYTGPQVTDHYNALLKARSKGGYVQSVLKKCGKTQCRKLEQTPK